MNITVEKLPKAEVKMIVELTETEMEKYYLQALEAISKQVNFPGFRPGNVPTNIVEEKVDKSAIMARAIDLALPPTYSEAVKKENIQAIGRPKVNITQDVPFTYEAIIPVYPEVSVKGYENIKIEPQPVKVEEKDIEEEVKRFQTHHAKYTEYEGPAKIGDKVEIDFEGFDEGRAQLEGTLSKNHPLTIGDKSLIPGFEENLVGMKKDEEKSFDVTFPADYHHKPFQSKKVTFKVTMRKIQNAELPELNAEFIKMLTGQEKSIEDFKKEIEQILIDHRTNQEKTRVEAEVFQKILEVTEVDLAPSLVDEEVEVLIDEMKHDMEEKGLTLEKYFEATGQTLEKIKEDRRKDAEQRLKVRFGLQELFKQEKVEVSAQDVEAEIESRLLTSPTEMHEDLRKQYRDNQELKLRIENQLRMTKLFEKFKK